MTSKLAKALLSMTWEEMDDFAARIAEVATDDEGNLNDCHYIAGALIGDAHDAADVEVYG